MNTRTCCQLFSVAALVAGIPACEQRDTSTPTTTPAPSTAATPMDQSETEADRRITAEIRKAVLAQEGMSINAQNCKIITRDGVVTLRGAVASTAESEMIQSKAQAVVGVRSVDNQLEVRVQ